jgi:23S rRNA G2445 N2-methylase RlmL
MSEHKTTDAGDDVIFARAPLQAAEWFVVCPTCGSGEIAIETTEDDAGAICPQAQDKWLRCPACDADIEVVAVSVTEAYPA